MPENRRLDVIWPILLVAPASAHKRTRRVRGTLRRANGPVPAPTRPMRPLPLPGAGLTAAPDWTGIAHAPQALRLDSGQGRASARRVVARGVRVRRGELLPDSAAPAARP